MPAAAASVDRVVGLEAIGDRATARAPEHEERAVVGDAAEARPRRFEVGADHGCPRQSVAPVSAASTVKRRNSVPVSGWRSSTTASTSSSSHMTLSGWR